MNKKWWVAAAVAVAAATGVVGQYGEVGAIGETGRISLIDLPFRIIDTRGGAGIAAGTSFALPTGLLTVMAKPRANGAGEADVYPCGASPDAEPTFRFDDDGFVTRSIVAGAALCIRPSVTVDLLVDVSGVLADPFVGGLQYEPLPTPEGAVASDFSTGTSPIPRRDSLPASASGATYSIDLFGDAASYAIVHPCGQPTLPPHVIVEAGGSGVGIANIPLGPGQQACITTGGSGFVAVTLLGAFNTTGPDPTRLPPGTTSRLASVAAPGFAPIAPDRAFDTRSDGSGKLRPTEVLEVDLIDYLTPSSTAVVMNVTVTGAESDGYLTVWPCDEAQPNASNLNFQAGVDVPNLVTVRLAVDGTICINGSATTHVLGDVAGTYEFGDGFGSTPISPVRIMDTRDGLGAPAVGANSTVQLQVAGRGGVPPSGVEAVTMNVTVTGSQADGYLTVWPCDQPQPNASNLNFRRGVDVPNLVTVKLAANGSVCIFSTAATHVLADLAMFFSSASTGGFIDVTPDRILDTRVPIGQPTRARLGAGSQITVQVSGRAGVPATGASSVTMNVTVTNTVADGYLTAWPCDQPRPEASNLNFRRGADVPNLVSVKLAANGTVCIFSTAPTDVIADVAGYTTDTPVSFWDVVIE